MSTEANPKVVPIRKPLLRLQRRFHPVRSTANGTTWQVIYRTSEDRTRRGNLVETGLQR